MCTLRVSLLFFFFFNDTATPEIYTLSLHDALPICDTAERDRLWQGRKKAFGAMGRLSRDLVVQDAVVPRQAADRKSTRLNSSHSQISYAVFCLKKKKKKITNQTHYALLQGRTRTSH